METRESAREREFLPISHPKNPLRRSQSNNSYHVFPEPQVNFDDGHEHSCACGSKTRSARCTPERPQSKKNGREMGSSYDGWMGGSRSKNNDA